MKILCDVCEKDEASFFCVADEASLCAACDHRVHHANKLAGKHHRFSLHHPSPKQAPLCDICQEKRGFLFCQQDRAILCKDCDIPIHKANEHTQKHSRFLLTGLKLSATSTLYSPELPPNGAVSNIDFQDNSKLSTTHVVAPKSSTTATSNSPVSSCDKNGSPLLCGSISTSSISEYLIETLPGWHVEDFLDSSSDFCKSGENDVFPIWGADVYKTSASVFTTENMGVWVPQAPPVHQHTPNHSFQSTHSLAFGFPNGYRDHYQCSKEFPDNNMMIKSGRKRSEDNSFAVPQIIPASTPIKKRSRNSLW